MLRDFTKERFDIFIQAGQSNNEGCGWGDVPKPYQPKGSVWYMNQNRTLSVAAEVAFGNKVRGDYALTFADEYRKKGLLAEGRKALIIKSAVGGTAFLDKRWGMEDDLFLQMMDMTRTALALNPENRIMALLWHQGETDARRQATYEQHYNNVSALFKAVRSEFGAGIPIITADFVPEWRDYGEVSFEAIIAAIRDAVEHVGNARFVSTEGLRSNGQMSGDGDRVHFCRDSLYELGRRYFEAYCELSGV